MAKGINKVLLLGHVGHDPVIKYTPSGDCVARMNLCVNQYWVDKKTGERKEKAGWHRLLFYKNKAEFAEKFIRKGSKILIEGQLNTRSYIDMRDKVERYITEIFIKEICLLSSPALSKHHAVPECANEPSFEEEPLPEAVFNEDEE